MERPSQLPPGVIPYHSAAGPTRGAGRIWRSSSSVNVACAPSTPPASASKDEYERALGGREVAQDEVQGLGDHAEILGSSTVLPRVQVGPGQLRLVGEHLLEVGNEPAGVGRVAAEPADEVVVDAAGRHGVERPQAHVPGVGRVGPATAGAPEAELDEAWAGGTSVPGRSRPTRGRSLPPDPPTTCSIRTSGSRPAAAGAPARRSTGAPSPPTPPPRRRPPPRSAPRPGGAPAARRPPSASACSRTWARSLAQASPSACTTRRNEGMPWRSTGGK